jgi:hypothetical protein
MSSEVSPIYVLDEIDLFTIIKIIWKKKNFIFAIVCISFFLGVIVSVVKNSKQYQSSCTFMLKSGGGSNMSGSVGGIVELAGISRPNSSSFPLTEIPPSLYPIIISSIEFKKALVDAPIKVDGLDKEITYAYYYENIVRPSRFELVKAYTMGLPRLLMNILKQGDSSINNGQKNIISENTKTIKRKNLLTLSSNEVAHFARLDNQLKLENKNGVYILSFIMPDPFIAAQMASFSLNLLQKEVTAYKLANLREELRVTELLYEEKKQSFKDIQNELGNFRDRNQNIVASFVQNKFEILQTEYNLRLNIVTQIANSLESTKIQIARNTPMFSILDPVTIPSSPNPQNQISIIVIFIASGIIIAISCVFGIETFKAFKLKWKHRFN